MSCGVAPSNNGMCCPPEPETVEAGNTVRVVWRPLDPRGKPWFPATTTATLTDPLGNETYPTIMTGQGRWWVDFIPDFEGKWCLVARALDPYEYTLTRCVEVTQDFLNPATIVTRFGQPVQDRLSSPVIVLAGPK